MRKESLITSRGGGGGSPKKGMTITMGQSETVNRKTNNTMADKRQTQSTKHYTEEN